MEENRFLPVSKEIDSEVSIILSSKEVGFQKAFLMSSALTLLREKLTPEYMFPIMQLQGSRLGFLTDKDIDQQTKRKGPGYPEHVVKDCVIDAVLMGLQPTGNEFNIIGGNMYPTREGFGSLLKKIAGLRYNLTYKKIDQPGGKTANVTVQIDWVLSPNPPTKQIVEFPVKSNDYASYDALIGKAERKARRWLYNHINGTDVSDGDVDDIPHTVVSSKRDLGHHNAEAERNRLVTLLNECDDLESLKRLRAEVKDEDMGAKWIEAHERITGEPWSE